MHRNALGLYLLFTWLSGCAPEPMRYVSTARDGGHEGDGDGDGDGEAGSGDGDGDGDEPAPNMSDGYTYRTIPQLIGAERTRPLTIGDQGHVVLVAELSDSRALDHLFLWRGGEEFEEIEVPEGYRYPPNNSNVACLLDGDRLMLDLTTGDSNARMPCIIDGDRVIELERPTTAIDGASVSIQRCNELGHYVTSTSTLGALQLFWFVGDGEPVLVYEQANELAPSVYAHGLGNNGVISLNLGYWTEEDGLQESPADFQFVGGPAEDGRIVGWEGGYGYEGGKPGFFDVDTGEVELFTGLDDYEHSIEGMAQNGDVLLGPPSSLKTLRKGRYHGLRILRVPIKAVYGFGPEGHALVMPEDAVDIEGLVFTPPD